MVMSSNNTLAYGFRIRFYAHIVPCFQQCLYVSDLHVLYFNSLFQLSYIIAIFTHFYAENYHVHCKSFSVKIVFASGVFDCKYCYCGVNSIFSFVHCSSILFICEIAIAMRSRLFNIIRMWTATR